MNLHEAVFIEVIDHKDKNAAILIIKIKIKRIKTFIINKKDAENPIDNPNQHKIIIKS